MGKLVVLKIGEGNFDVGFPVTLQIGEDTHRASTETTGWLPPIPEMPLQYNHWQSSYRQLGNGYRLSADKAQVTNVSVTQECENTARILRTTFNTWLQAEKFRPIRETWLEKLSPTDEIRVILQTENSQLQRLPWNQWDLMSRYPNAEIALASPSYDRIDKPRNPNPKVNILAIVGNSEGIDTQADRNLLENLPSASVKFLVEPQRQELTDQLWAQNWDILFFAGHTSSHGNDDTGRIYLNKTDSLSISELKFALRKAVESGLHLAIFNSCDGLGLARELADLYIPQTIFMREPVPDHVAQEFLKYFLQHYAGGDSLYLALRHTRERLQGLENIFPCATWLPVIFQNLAQIPPSWADLLPAKVPQTKISSTTQKPRLATTIFSSLAIALAIAGCRWLGMLQGGELQVFDQMMRLRPREGADPRLLVVSIDDQDLLEQRRQGESLKGTSLSDKSLNLLLEKLQQYQPLVIGLDVYRDFPAEPQNLITRLQQTENLIAVCKGSDSTSNTYGIKPPPEIPQRRLGFSDFIHDSHGVVRRHLLFMRQEAASLCSADYSLSVQLAFRYLGTQGIQPQFTPQGDLQLGKTVFHKLASHASGYQGIDANGAQILLNWRSSNKIAEQVTLRQILSGSVNPSAFKDRIVLIGVTAKGDLPDYWGTPYGTRIEEQMPGVIVHAHMVSQILSAVLNGRPLLKTWHPLLELMWICGWSVSGGLIAWFVQKPLLKFVIAISISTVALYVFCFGLLIQGYWVPFLPSALGFIGGGSSVIVYSKIRLSTDSQLKLSIF
ncbi:MAG: CHASE2 domain-containing protein [Nostocaceae cyanobacterium]|nr:CHASE2 domain-containing protein [Nostocaceae cyanobacterium]